MTLRGLRPDRSTAAVATLALHALIIALLMLPAAVPQRSAPRALAVFDISAAAAMPDAQPKAAPQPQPIKPKPPEPIIAPPPVVALPTPNETVISLLAQSDAAAASGACDLTEPVQAALRKSEVVAASIPQIPQTRRSVANAIMIWNADWVALHETLDPTAMTAIRDTIAQTVAAASPECRLQPQNGPRLMLLPGVSETIVLALGSGRWRWQDLLDTAQAKTSEQAESDRPRSVIKLTKFHRASIAGG